MGLRESVAALALAAEGNAEARPLLEWYRERQQMTGRYVEAYRRYCWPVHALDDLKLAPFHLLASEGAVHIDKDHVWHMKMAARLAEAEPGLILATPFKMVDLAEEASVAEGVAWWEELTSAGGEGGGEAGGFCGARAAGVTQPAVKCRGREYLRIIYGPEYTAAQHLERLRARGVGAKRSLALREFALGIEGLQRFVERDPLRRVHECVFGVLALESEAVDPRL